jgi:putative ABC transport system substrate-binding protein
MLYSTIGCLVALAFALLAAPLAADAQLAGKKAVRIGYLGVAPRPPDEAFRQALGELGYIEGQNVNIEYRWGEGSGRSYTDLAEELVRLNVDVIVTVASPATRAAKHASSTIPIVMIDVGDPVAFGFVASLARPGANATGLSAASTQYSSKGLEILKEVVPHAARVAVLQNPTNPGAPFADRVLESIAPVLGMHLQFQYVREHDDVQRAFATMIRERPDTLIVMPDHFLFTQREGIIEFAAKNDLPAMYLLREYVAGGGLMGFWPDRMAMFRRAASYVDKILKGTKPADLPVEQPMKFELVLNLKTAKALGVTFPPAILLQATEVVQ